MRWSPSSFSISRSIPPGPTARPWPASPAISTRPMSPPTICGWRPSKRSPVSIARTASPISTPSASPASSSPRFSTRCRTRCARPISRWPAAPGPQSARGPYPIFDNVTAIFSATPVITRTATYLYACVEWVEDAFKGKELLHEIYSRLLNPTSVSLANHIVDVEAGPLRRRIFRLELQLRHGGDRCDARPPARLPGHRARQPQRLRRQLSAAARLVRQARQSRYRRRIGSTASAWRTFAAALARSQNAHRDRLAVGPPRLCLSGKPVQSARLCPRRSGHLPKRRTRAD